MIVLIAQHLAPAVRGRLKLWFIEPKPNVFVSGIKDHQAEKVVEYLMQQKLGAESLLFFSFNQPPWYRVYSYGSIDSMLKLSGLPLCIATRRNSDND